jgi:hypothetical protein
MQFEPIPLQALKSISQRNFARHWQELHARDGLPRFKDFSPGNRAHDPRQMLLWAVDGDGTSFSYRPLYGGQYVYEVFGIGASVASVPPSLQQIFQHGLDTCAASASMIYMTIATTDSAGHPIEGERLLLPFGGPDGAVRHILASVQLVSLAGTFQRQNVIQHFERRADVTFCGRIEPATAATAAAAVVPSRQARKPVGVP